MTTRIVRVAMLLALSVMGSVAAYAAAEAPPAPMSSTKEKGVVSIVPDTALSQGRLVLKVVAFNRTRQPAPFGDADVKIFTSTGTPVALVPLEQLIQEASGSSGQSRSATVDPNTSGYAHRPLSTFGESRAMDVTGYTGAGNPMTGVVSTQTQADPHGANAQIESLKASILQSLIIPSAQAAGGQVVSEPLKLSRKESRELRVTVDFNGEQHEFRIVAPRK